MKRSEMVEILRSDLEKRFDEDHVSRWLADDLLEVLEKSGMLPPWTEEAKLCSCSSFGSCPGCNISKYTPEWEK